jgi:hypothetical protein
MTPKLVVINADVLQKATLSAHLSEKRTVQLLLEESLAATKEHAAGATISSVFAQLGVLSFGLSIDGKIGVGVFPNAKEFFVRFAGGCVVAHQSLCPTELKPGQWAGYKFPA